MANEISKFIIDSTGSYSISIGSGIGSNPVRRKTIKVFAKMVDSERNFYWGEFKDNQLHGQGEFRNQMVVCKGDWRNGNLCGNARINILNVLFYDGEIFQNEINGEGRCTLPNGDYWIGTWKSNAPIAIREAELTRSLLLGINSIRDGLSSEIFPCLYFRSVLKIMTLLKPEKIANIRSIMEALKFGIQKKVSYHFQAIRSGQLAIILSGWKEHSVVIVIYKNQLLICNRGQGRKDFTTKMYRINPEKITKKIIEEIVSEGNLPQSEREKFIYETLPQSLDANPGESEFEQRLTTSSQKIGNCCFTSCKEAIKGSFALLLLDQGLPIEEATSKAQELKKLCSTIARLQLWHEYQEKVAARVIRPFRESLEEVIQNKTMKAYRKCAQSLNSLSPEEFPWVMAGRN